MKTRVYFENNKIVEIILVPSEKENPDELHNLSKMLLVENPACDFVQMLKEHTFDNYTDDEYGPIKDCFTMISEKLFEGKPTANIFLLFSRLLTLTFRPSIPTILLRNPDYTGRSPVPQPLFEVSETMADLIDTDFSDEGLEDGAEEEAEESDEDEEEEAATLEATEVPVEQYLPFDFMEKYELSLRDRRILTRHIANAHFSCEELIETQDFTPICPNFETTFLIPDDHAIQYIPKRDTLLVITFYDPRCLVPTDRTERKAAEPYLNHIILQENAVKNDVFSSMKNKKHILWFEYDYQHHGSPLRFAGELEPVASHSRDGHSYYEMVILPKT